MCSATFCTYVYIHLFLQWATRAHYPESSCCWCVIFSLIFHLARSAVQCSAMQCIVKVIYKRKKQKLRSASIQAPPRLRLRVLCPAASFFL